MNRIILLLLIVIITALAASGYYFFAPSQIGKRRAQEMLNGISSIFETQKREQIQSLLGSLLTPDAEVTLQIVFPSLPGEKSRNSEAEKFGKDDFLRFIDNTLYTVSDYHFSAHAQSVELGADGLNGSVEFTARAKATGMQMDGNMHFSSDMQCIADMYFDKAAVPEIKTLGCVVQLHYGMTGSKAP